MYFQIQLTLNLLSYILLIVVLAVLFDAKSTKNFGTRKKSSQAPFAHATIGEHSVGRASVFPLFTLTTPSSRNPQGVTLPRYLRPIAAGSFIEEGDPKVKMGYPLEFCSAIILLLRNDKKYSYSIDKHWNSYCLFGKYLLSLYYHIKS